MMNSMRQKADLFRLSFWVAAFVALICVRILGRSGWHELTSRANNLKNAEVDMANLARSLTQHAEDSFDLLDASILGIVGRLETEGALREPQFQSKKEFASTLIRYVVNGNANSAEQTDSRTAS